jgi:hypothetical protein
MPSCKTWAGGNWFEEDSDWHLVALAFPEAFEPKHVEAAHRTAAGVVKQREQEAWDKANPTFIRSAMNVRPNEFNPTKEPLATGEATEGQLVLVGWQDEEGKGRAAIVRGYAEARERLGRQPFITDCEATKLSADDLQPASWAATVAGRMQRDR